MRGSETRGRGQGEAKKLWRSQKGLLVFKKSSHKRFSFGGEPGRALKVPPGVRAKRHGA